MTIEIKEKGSRQFYEEAANVTAQYRQLMKKPQAKLGNNFRLYTILTVVLAVLFVMNVFFGVRGSFDSTKIAVLAVVAVAEYTTVTYLKKMKKMVEDNLADDRAVTVTLDDKGVAISREGGDAVRLAWSNVAFVRSFKESICFFSEDQSGTVLAVDNAYKQEILDYLRNDNHRIPVIY